MLNIGVLASGRGSNFQAIVDAIEAGYIKGARVALLIVDKEDAYAVERAKKHNIPHRFINPRDYAGKDEYNLAMAEELKKQGCGLVVLAGYMRVVRKPLIEAFPMRIINIHPALLPSFPGLHGQGDALKYGVKLAGCTVHFVDEGVDTGPIIIQASVPVYDDDTEETLSARILRQEHRIYPEAVRLIAEGRVSLVGRKVLIKGNKRQEEARINPPIN